MRKLVTIYQEIQNSIGYFLKLYRFGKKKDVTPEQIMKLIYMADSCKLKPVDNTMSTAAGLEKESLFPTTHPALPYYQPTDISFGFI